MTDKTYNYKLAYVEKRREEDPTSYSTDDKCYEGDVIRPDGAYFHFVCRITHQSGAPVLHLGPPAQEADEASQEAQQEGRFLTM